MVSLNRLFVPHVEDTDLLRTLREQRPGYGTADPGMVAQPYADPGYALPNVDISSLPQGAGGVSRAYPTSAQAPQTQTGWKFDPAQAQAELQRYQTAAFDPSEFQRARDYGTPKTDTPSEPLWNYPDPRARVPPDTMVDFPAAVYDVNSQDETTARISPDRNIFENQLLRQIALAPNIPADVSAMTRGMQSAKRR